MPAAVFWLYFLAMGICDAVHDRYATNFFGLSALASRWLLPFMVATWVVADAQRRNLRLCYDFDSFVFFADAILVPYHLFATHKSRAFVTLACFLAMYVSGLVFAFVFSKFFFR